jgi:hypothetical protein
MEELAGQVKRNCDIADAKGWGFYSICGLLLRYRELYHSEKGLRPWQKAESSEILQWIAVKESRWEGLAGEPFHEIRIDGHPYNAFDTDSINRVLSGKGLVYGAGYGAHLNPTFFLAELARTEEIHGLVVYTSGRELARDLSGAVAMLKEDTVFARTEPSEFLIWHKFEEYMAKQGAKRGALEIAFSSYGIGPDEPNFDRLSDVAKMELSTYVMHEVGEWDEGHRLGPRWKAMSSGAMSKGAGGRKAALFLRALKDVLADTSENGMVRHIVQNRLSGSLAFYMVFMSGYRKLLSHHMEKAFGKFSGSGDWPAVEEAREDTYREARGTAGALLYAFSSGKDIEPLIEESIKSLNRQ